ncbi:hypothetical protein EON65_51675 [archaeon]|nr:MAG: hypothetical protein EON65_51675 [archaeon]
MAIQSCKQIGRDLRKCAVAPSGGVGALARPQSRLSPAMYTAVHSMSTKKVHRYSWAADRLEQLGEQLIEPEKRELIEVTDEMLHNPPDKIKKMGEEIIDLNLLEINQLINLIQVCSTVQ